MKIPTQYMGRDFCALEKERRFTSATIQCDGNEKVVSRIVRRSECTGEKQIKATQGNGNKVVKQPRLAAGM